MGHLLLMWLPAVVGLAGAGVAKGLGLRSPRPELFALLVGCAGSLLWGYLAGGALTSGLCPALASFLVVSGMMGRGSTRGPGKSDS